jgi:hypothetical protein
MAQANFDPNIFLSQPIEGATSTEMLNCPVGEYTMIAEKFELKPWTNDGRDSLMVNITWSIEDEGVRNYMGRSKVLVPQTLWINIEDGKIPTAKGKNVSLGIFREAIGKNTGNFNFSDIPGSMAKGKVSHRPGKDERAGQIFPFVEAVAKL